ELIGATNLDLDFSALGLKGRIIIVGTTAGQEGAISLRTLMGKRASLRGTVLRARPAEEKAAAVQAFIRSVVPLLAAGRALPEIDRVFPAAEAAAAFDYLVEPGKSGEVLLDFGCALARQCADDRLCHRHRLVLGDRPGDRGTPGRGRLPGAAGGYPPRPANRRRRAHRRGDPRAGRPVRVRPHRRVVPAGM